MRVRIISPGTLLPVVFDEPITPEQYRQIRAIVFPIEDKEECFFCRKLRIVETTVTVDGKVVPLCEKCYQIGEDGRRAEAGGDQ